MWLGILSSNDVWHLSSLQLSLLKSVDADFGLESFVPMMLQEHYCERWGMTVNIVKTKLLLLRFCPHSSEHFTMRMCMDAAF